MYSKKDKVIWVQSYTEYNALNFPNLAHLNDVYGTLYPNP